MANENDPHNAREYEFARMIFGVVVGFLFARGFGRKRLIEMLDASIDASRAAQRSGLTIEDVEKAFATPKNT